MLGRRMLRCACKKADVLKNKTRKHEKMKKVRQIITQSIQVENVNLCQLLTFYACASAYICTQNHKMKITSN